MSNTLNNELQSLINDFDSLDLNNANIRRSGFQLLHDFFQKLMMHAGQKIGYPENVFIELGVKTRWILISRNLKNVCNPDGWNRLIDLVNRIRNAIQHNESHVPEKQKIERIRHHIPSFASWLIENSNVFVRQSPRYNFKQVFCLIAKRALISANFIFYQFGEEPPYFATLDLHWQIPFTDSIESYQDFKIAVKQLENRLDELINSDEILSSDLELVNSISDTVAFLKARKHLLTVNGTCPKCGSSITETSESSGGTIDDPEPRAIHYRIGCQNCDYEIENQIIDA